MDSNWSPPLPTKGQLVGKVVPVGQACRTLPRRSWHWQMRRLTWKQSGGNPEGTLGDARVNIAGERDEFMPSSGGTAEEGNMPLHFDNGTLTWARKGHSLPPWTTKILCCQTWDFSSSVELSAAVLKQTPQQEGRRPYPLSKIGRRRLGGHEEFGTRHSRPAPTVCQMCFKVISDRNHEKHSVEKPLSR